MGRVTDITEEMTEETVMEIGIVRQDGMNNTDSDTGGENGNNGGSGSGNSSSGNSGSGNSSSGNSDSGNSGSGNSSSGNSDSGNSSSGNSDSGNSGSGDGDSGNSGNSGSGDGDNGNGDGGSGNSGSGDGDGGSGNSGSGDGDSDNSGSDGNGNGTSDDPPINSSSKTDEKSTIAVAKSDEGDGSEKSEMESDEDTEVTKTDLQIWHDGDDDKETPIELAPNVISLEAMNEGDTYQLEAAGEGSDKVTWMSTNTDVATVNEVGLVTFTGEEGEVTIQLWSSNAVVADSVIFSTVAEAPTEPVEEPKGGVMDTIGGIFPFVLIALLSLVIIILLIMRSAEQKRRRKRAAKKKARQSGSGYTEVQRGTVPTPLDVPVEDAVAAIQPATGIRTGVYQAIGARKDQQDSYGMTDPALYAQQGVLALVADGMGGLANGKAVSSALVNTFLGEFRALAERETPQDALLKLSISANQRINQMLMGAERSGSTLVSVVVRDGCLYFLTVGDSRIYLYRGGALLQLNREHIYQEELAVKAVNCQTPLSQVTADRQAHALTSFFGSGSITHIDRNYEAIRLVPGDRVLLCSDGVFGTLTQAQMERAMDNDVKTAAETLKDMVLDAGKLHQDNNTCLILEYLG